MATARALEQSLTEVTTAVRHAETTEQHLARQLAEQNRRGLQFRDTLTDTAQQLAKGDPMPAATTSKNTSKKNSRSQRRPAATTKPTRKSGPTRKSAAAKEASAASSSTSRSTTATKKTARKSDTKPVKKSGPAKKRSSAKATSSKTGTKVRQAQTQLDALRDREKKIGKRAEKHDKTVKSLKKDLKRSEKTLATVHDNLNNAKRARRKAQNRLAAVAG